LAGCLKPGGLVVAAHTAGSTGCRSGADTRFPVGLGVEDICQAYRDANLDFEVTPIVDGELGVTEATYSGPLLVVARRRL
jgi:hypothetical protein